MPKCTVEAQSSDADLETGTGFSVHELMRNSTPGSDFNEVGGI